VKRAYALGLTALVAAALAGCDKPKEFRLTSVPPPGQVGTLDEHRIRLSRGVALAIECIEPGETVGTCGRLRARSNRPDVARAFGADTDQLAGVWVPGRASAVTQRRSVFVVAGLAPGRAQIDVYSADGVESFEIEVP
jgi:hypothetical protein